MKTKICKHNFIAALLAITPFLKYYRISFIDLNLALAIFLIISIYGFIVKIGNRNFFTVVEHNIFSPIFITMMVYMFAQTMIIAVLDSTNQKIDFIGIVAFWILLWNFIILAGDHGIQSAFKRTIVVISLLMSGVVITQTILYYFGNVIIGDGRFFLIPMRQFMEKSVVNYLTIGDMKHLGLFRPSSFFLEPAHHCQYCILGLCCTLFDRKAINRKSIIISVGIILTTSGMGIIAMVVLWTLRFLLGLKKITYRKFLAIGGLLLIAILGFIYLYNAGGAFTATIDRLMGRTEYNPFEGRLGTILHVYNLTGIDRWIGVGFENLPTYGEFNTPVYMTSLVETMYCQGIIGIVLLIILYIKQCIFLFKNKHFDELFIFTALGIWFCGESITTPACLMVYILLVTEHITKRHSIILYKSERKRKD